MGAVLSACAASTRPADDPRAYAAAARALGANTDGDRCRFDAGDLAARAIAAWSARESRGASTSSEARNAPRAPDAADWACVATMDDLSRDSMGSCAPAPDATLRAPAGYVRRVVGELFYVGIDPREYAYDLLGRGDGVDVEVRVQFTGPLARDAPTVARMQEKMTRAARLWSSASPEGRIRFRFLAVPSEDDAPHFQVHLAAGDARTPFDVSWSTEWSWHLVAHEIGHMMGLDDEYGQLRKTLGHALGREDRWRADPVERMRWFGCDLSSLMCDSKGESSTPQRYHYYVILRRRFCSATAPDAPPSP